MRALDTNLLVRLIQRDDASQFALAKNFAADGAWASHLVVAEAIWVLESVYGFDRSRVVKAVGMMLNHQSLVFQDPDTVAAALDHYRSPPFPEFSDCLILEVARKNGNLPIGTFDRRFSRLPGVQRV
jgi:predicted nucleic-acid-binding protein